MSRAHMRRIGIVCLGLVLSWGGMCLVQPTAAHRTATALAVAGGPDAKAPLAALVPADAGLCIETRDLATHADRFLNGPIYARLARYEPVERWAKAGWPQVQRTAAEFQRRLGASPDEMWRRLLGHRALLAVWPPSAPDQDGPALFIVESLDASLLGQVLERLVQALREEGLWKETRTIELDGVAHRVHVMETDRDKGAVYLAASGELAIMSNREDLVRHVLTARGAAFDRADRPERADRAGKAGGADTLASQAAYVEAASRLSVGAPVTVIVNPRIWDQSLSRGIGNQAPDASDAAAQASLAETWKAIEWIAASIELDPAPRIEAFVRWALDRLPEEGRVIAGSLSGGSELWPKVPSDALFAVACRADVGRLLRRFGPLNQGTGDAGRAGASSDDQVPSGVRAGLSLVAGLGPDFCACLVPRAMRSTVALEHSDGLGVDWVVGVQTQPVGPESPALSELLDPLLKGGLDLMAAAANAEAGTARVTTHVKNIEGDRLIWVEGFPPAEGIAIEPSLMVSGGRLWAGTSPAAVERVARLPATDAVMGDPRRADLNRPATAQPGFVLYCDAAAMRRTLTDSPALFEKLSRSDGLDSAQAEKSRGELLALLGLADTVLVTARLDEQGLSASLVISADSEPDPASSKPRPPQRTTGGR